MASKRPRLIHVNLWATQTYGEFAPSPYALRMWIKRGKIQPPPQRLLGKWYVKPTAEYKDS